MEKPGLGIRILILDNGKALLGKRKGSHGEGTWSFPGGHIEMFETFEDAIKREVREETNLNVNIINSLHLAVTNDFFKDENKYHITLFFRANAKNLKELKLMEPDKCSDWNWFK